jgi:DNA-binding transcriptional LysR family regulator
VTRLTGAGKAARRTRTTGVPNRFELTGATRRRSVGRPFAGPPEPVLPESLHHLSDLGLSRIRSFVLLAEELHFGHAADDLFLSQPALSQQIAHLEKTLGVGLFRRGRRSVTLTPSGRALLRGCRRVMEIMDDAVAAARTEAACDAAVVLSYAPGSPRTFVDALSAELSTKLVSAEVIAVGRSLADQVRLVAEGGSYAGIAYQDVLTSDAAVTVTTIGTDPYVLLVASDHPVAACAEPGFTDLTGLRLVRAPGAVYPCWRCATGPATRCRAGCRATEVDDLVTAVVDDHAGAVLPESWAAEIDHPGISRRPLAMLPPVPLAVVSAEWASRVETARLIELGRAVWRWCRTPDAVDLAA